MFKDPESRQKLVMGLGIITLLLFSANVFAFVKQQIRNDKHDHEHVVVEHLEAPAMEHTVTMHHFSKKPHVRVEIQEPDELDRALDFEFSQLERELQRLEHELDGLHLEHGLASRSVRPKREFSERHRRHYQHKREMNSLSLDLERLEHELQRELGEKHFKLRLHLDNDRLHEEAKRQRTEANNER